MSKIRLFFDMDGCVSDFQKAYKKYQEQDAAMEGEIENILIFERAIKDGVYRDLDWMPNGDRLADQIEQYARDSRFFVAMLSSTGTIRIPHCKEAVVTQKMDWLFKKGIRVPAFFVERKIDKSLYAARDSILIDDKQGCIKPFEMQGGEGVLYFDSEFEDSMLALEEAIKVVEMNKR